MFSFKGYLRLLFFQYCTKIVTKYHFKATLVHLWFDFNKAFTKRQVSSFLNEIGVYIGFLILLWFNVISSDILENTVCI